MSKSATVLTTSWDDGYPLDLKIAELLAKYGLPGTFYVPIHAERTQLSSAQIGDIASTFEIGSHTVHEVDLTTLDDTAVTVELEESKAALEQVVQRQIVMFAPVRGHFRPHHVGMVERAGYLGLRTVELLSIDPPKTRAGIRELSTTVQAFAHPVGGYVRNMLKRGEYRRLGIPGVFTRNPDWFQIGALLLERALNEGGVFHLWGHSWEIEERNEWSRVEQLLALMGEARQRSTCMSNGELCRAVATPRSAAAGETVEGMIGK